MSLTTKGDTTMKEQGVIFVDGHVVGFQFNKNSAGARTFHRMVEVKEDGTGRARIPALGCIRVRRIENSRFWQAY